MAQLNLQQQPSSPEYLKCFMARPGYKIISMDFSALEPKVTAYYSRDKNLLNLYGNEAKRNDVYLYNACKMGELGKNILATGYDPDSPTIAAIARAKSECKSDRNIAKTITLASNYGAGPNKIHDTLRLAGQTITLSQCREYHRSFWKMYSGVKEFERRLKNMYYDNNGYVFNGYGRPLCVADEKIKDLLNRFIQSTGHDILMTFILNIRKEVPKNVEWYPWLIDFHDETMVEVKEDHVPEMKKSFQRALNSVNKRLDWDILMEGTIKVSNNLAEVKSD